MRVILESVAAFALVFLPLARGQANYTVPYTFTTIAGDTEYGFDDGIGTDARFADPQGIAVDRGGNLYVADHGSDAIRMIAPLLSGGQTNWVVTTIAGLPATPGSADGTGSAARFSQPRGLAVDGAGNLFVADFANQTIREITPSVSAGQTNWLVTTIAGAPGQHGSADGPGPQARFSFPTGVTADRLGNLYVADEGNATIRRLQMPSSAGQTNWMASTIAGLAGQHGSTDGAGTNARFFNPFQLAFDSAGNLYVTDYGSSTIRKLAPAQSAASSNWVVSTIAGAVGNFGSDDGTGTNAQFLNPYGIAVDLGGVLFVVDSGNNTVRRLSQTVVAGITNWIVSTIAGSADFYGVSDGTGANALFDYPNEIALDRAGTLYVTDTYNNTVRRGWSPPVIVLGVPSYTASQVQIGFALAAGSAASFSLLNAPSLSGPWVTNTLATLVTNLPGVSFTFTVPLSQNPAQFCRVQSP